MPGWKFITSHGAVLILIAQHGQITVREMADRLALTERLIHRIIAELTADGYLSKHRVGRVNQYRVHFDMPLRRPVLQEMTLGEALQGMKVSPQDPIDGLTQPSRNAAGETEPRLRLRFPDVPTATLSRNRQHVEAVCARARLLLQETRKVCETNRRVRAERARLL